MSALAGEQTFMKKILFWAFKLLKKIFVWKKVISAEFQEFLKAKGFLDLYSDREELAKFFFTIFSKAIFG